MTTRQHFAIAPAEATPAPRMLALLPEPPHRALAPESLWRVARCPPSASRTADAERVVDEMVISFTHDIEMPWLRPGIAPNRPAGGDSARRRHCVPGRQGRERAHLLGLGLGPGADRSASVFWSARTGRRTGEGTARSDRDAQHSRDIDRTRVTDLRD